MNNNYTAFIFTYFQSKFATEIPNIQPANIHVASITKNICNGTSLLINWQPLPGSKYVAHQIYVNGTIR